MISSTACLAAIALILVTSTLPVAEAQCGAQCDTLTAWRDTLFAGLTTVPKKGGWSRVLTFKDTAMVALTGNTAEDSLIALATLGSGRVAAFANDRQVKNLGGQESNTDLGILHTNLMTWLKDGDTGTWLICEPTSSSGLSACLGDPSVRTLLSVSGVWPTDADNDAVTAWVSQGNTLVSSFDKNIFQSSTSESAKHIAFTRTLLAAGIAYDPSTGETVWPILIAADVSQLVDLNLQNVADSLTWENFEANTRLSYVLDLVKNKPRYFLAEVAQHVLQPFEAFASSAESNMIWPVATPSDPKNFVIVTTQHQALYNLFFTLSLAGLWRAKAPNINTYPGDVASPSPPNTASFTFTSLADRHFFSTNYYVVPGDDVTISVTNSAADDSWMDFEIYIGSATDILTSLTKLARFPIISRKEELVDREMTIRWPFGGLLYVRGPGKLGSTLEVTFHGGIVSTPYLDVTTDTVGVDALWAVRCQTPGLVADVRGELVRFTVRVDGGVCSLNGSQLRDTVLLWDHALRKNYELKGDDNSTRQQSFTADIQTKIGALHSGFPIVGKQDYELASENIFYLHGDWASAWGPFHELGHNLMEKWWTYSEVTEVTCNIFAVFGFERMAGYTWATLPKTVSQLTAGGNFEDWTANPTYENTDYKALTRLLVFTQVIRDFGWGCQRDVFKSYFDASPANTLPSTTQEERDEWVRRWSVQVGYNLCPLFGDFWKWPLDATMCSDLTTLPAYLPYDDVTEHTAAVSLTNSVLSLYPGILRNVTTTPSCDPFDIESL